MKPLLYSKIALIVLSIILTACSSSSGGNVGSNNVGSGDVADDGSDFDVCVDNDSCDNETPTDEALVDEIITDDMPDLVVRDDEAIATPIMVTLPDGVTPVIPIDANTNLPYTTLAGVANGAATIVMKGTTAYGSDSATYMRESNVSWSDAQEATEREISVARLDGAVASISFNNANKISEVTLYLNDRIYTANNAANNADSSATSFTGDIITGAPTDATDSTINVERGTSWFGFDSKYMTYISWNISKTADLTDANTALTDTNYNIDGMMVAGIETEAGNIQQAGSAVFTGEGHGYLDSNQGDRWTSTFTVNANVDFTQKTVSIDSTDTKICNNEEFDSCLTVDFMNFATLAPISYQNEENQTVNHVSGEFTTKNNADFIGIIDARFYGTDSSEFGGTFAGSDGANHYYGSFGAKR